MLTYHAAFDVYHCAFRCSLLLENHPEQSMTVDALRILDLCFLFPQIMNSFDFPKGVKTEGTRFASPPSKYNNIQSPKYFLRQSKLLNSTALSALAGRKLLDEGELRNGIAHRTSEPLPSEFLSKANEDDKELAVFLATKLGTIPLLGPKGLKARTHLMEFRYDAV